MFPKNPVGSEVSLNIWFYGVLSTLKTLPEKSVGGKGAFSPREADETSFSEYFSQHENSFSEEPDGPSDS